MSKKKEKQLLNESTIRNFMKLANIGKLSENFVSKIKEEEEEPEIEDEMSPEEELPPIDEPPMDEPEMEAPSEAGGEGFVEDLISAIAGAIEGVTGIPVSVEGGEEGSEEMPDMSPEEELPPTDEPPMEEEPIEDIDEKCSGKLVKEEDVVSGDRVESSEDQRELSPRDQVVEEDKNFGGTKDAKMKDAPKSKKVEETKKKKLTKQEMIAEVTKRVIERLSKKK